MSLKRGDDPIANATVDPQRFGQRGDAHATFNRNHPQRHQAPIQGLQNLTFRTFAAEPEGKGWMHEAIRQNARHPEVVTDSYLHSMMMAICGSNGTHPISRTNTRPATTSRLAHRNGAISHVRSW